MRVKSRVYNTIIKILSQHKKWLDVRHKFTLAWMVVGLIRSEKISPRQIVSISCPFICAKPYISVIINGNIVHS